MRRLFPAAVVAASAALVFSGCTNLLAGHPVSIFADPFRVAGLPATDGPSGLRPDAAAPTREVEDSDGGKEDELAVQSVSDVEEFWDGAYQPPLEGHFQPATALVSWDARDFSTQRFCGNETYDFVNAVYCWDDNNIGWDRGELLPLLRKTFGDISIPLVLGHEYGHAVQRRAQLAGTATPSLVAEQQADCFAGVYMRWVAEGKSPRFTMSTGEGLNNVLATVISLRDPVQSEGESDGDEHGSAFERISAFQMGFTDGAPACASIDKDEIAKRRGDLPVALTQDTTGEWPVSEDSVTAIVDAMTQTFSPADPPKLTFDASEADACPDARPSKPASYCPAANTIAVDLDKLEEMGTPSQERGGFNLPLGDNTAYSVVVSRYMLAIQKQKQPSVVLDNAAAALRTACLTGVATTKLSQQITVNGHTVQLAAGDLDEAVSGMLTNGLAASDVNGESVPSGFSRIDAFRAGVLGDENRCFQRYP
ncbi:MAG: neutral zinc metallopeptidase [Candidatus Sericytochromatia bacterium]